MFLKCVFFNIAPVIRPPPWSCFVSDFNRCLYKIKILQKKNSKFSFRSVPQNIITQGANYTLRNGTKRELRKILYFTTKIFCAMCFFLKTIFALVLFFSRNRNLLYQLTLPTKCCTYIHFNANVDWTSFNLNDIVKNDF